jgi:ADP-glucose type glycogen/starch synthase
MDVNRLISEELRIYLSHLSDNRIHLAEDRVFYYRDRIYSSYLEDSFKVSLAFQREVLNNIIPRVNPDLIHCNDWMTGLIPAMSRRIGVPCLFTLHNIHTQKMSLEKIEDSGIDAAEFWRNLYYERTPGSYEETRWSNPVDLLTSGIFASHYINTVSPTFLREVVDGRHDFIPEHIRREVAAKQASGCAVGILNAPDEDFSPETDDALACTYTAATHVSAKRANKVALQERLGLSVNPDAPLFYWPSRLDPMQKGCQLLTDCLYRIVADYWDQHLQVAVIANGSYQRHFHEIVRLHGIEDRVAVCDFEEDLSRLGYAGSDFMLMPSRFEPCGLPQMICQIYGSLPVVHDTGGLHDTVTHLNVEAETGSGFVFETYDTGGLRWAVDQAMSFHSQPSEAKEETVARVMTESAERFNHTVTARQYIDIYESMLQRPLVKEL